MDHLHNAIKRIVESILVGMPHPRRGIVASVESYDNAGKSEYARLD